MQRQADLAVYRAELKIQLLRHERPALLAKLSPTDAITLLAEILRDGARSGPPREPWSLTALVGAGIVLVSFWVAPALSLPVMLLVMVVVMIQREQGKINVPTRSLVWKRAQHLLADYLDTPPRNATLPLLTALAALDSGRYPRERELEARLAGGLTTLLPFLTPYDAHQLDADQRDYLIDVIRERAAANGQSRVTTRSPFVIATLLLLASGEEKGAVTSARRLAAHDANEHVREAAADYLRVCGWS